MRHLTILLVLVNRFVKYPERFLISLVSEFHSVVALYTKLNLTQSFRYTTCSPAFGNLQLFIVSGITAVNLSPLGN